MEMREGAPLPTESPSPTTDATTDQPRRKRQRRWHHRGFTGCQTCRRRHVRCDEASPTCNNCMRLGLDCSGTQGMTFKVFGGPKKDKETPQSNPPQKRRKLDSPDSSSESSTGSPGIVVKREEEPCDGLVVSPTTLPLPKTMQFQFRFQEPISPANLMASTIQSPDDRYYTHFIDQVSTLLLIYDNSMNTNPYRSCFPDFARSSPSMVGAMQALGALHLANTSVGPPRNKHFQHAMGKYGEVVKLFRDRYTQPSEQLGMTDFATCLLLCLFEVSKGRCTNDGKSADTIIDKMMDSQQQNWKVHLKGARAIYNLIFFPHANSPAHEEKRLVETNHPLRSFLVSLLSYLDVAGACATPGGTVVQGNYWKTLGGGWEYNLGIPSLSSGTMPDNPRLVELRAAWSGMMEVQAEISTFARDKQWMSPEHQDMIYKEIFHRLVIWRASTPVSLQLLGDMDLDDDSLARFPFPDMLEYVGCIEAYEKATFVHLHQVAGAGRPNWISDRTYLDMLITRIITLIRKLSKDVGQLAVLWPLFIAGQETRQNHEQEYVRATMHELRRFGFRNVDKAFQLLEDLWFKRRVFPEGWTETLDEIQSNILLP
ncbi:hypothetical protein N7532_007773 [Penicillium argentinense]|uniref:Zn(2)-C6 fungal-type domain-containing protein n=1 Tax=Penicillium argentinense TaxID=1131581 RepID=A0A9W9EW99_9EURO|nr:uncharacterized protein N7532_007773 [Penicillium argentinense]KAJ5089089.1 hypothetical protein N7532_007773 [Penicillium argentinense]